MIPVRALAKHETIGLVESWFIDHNTIMLEAEDGEMFALNVKSGNVSRVREFKSNIRRIMGLVVGGKRRYKHFNSSEAACDGRGYSVDCALEVIPTLFSTVTRLIIERADPAGIEKTMVEQRRGRVTVTQRKSSGGYSFFRMEESSPSVFFPEEESSEVPELYPIQENLEDLLVWLYDDIADEFMMMNWPDPD